MLNVRLLLLPPSFPNKRNLTNRVLAGLLQKANSTLICTRCRTHSSKCSGTLYTRKVLLECLNQSKKKKKKSHASTWIFAILMKFFFPLPMHLSFSCLYKMTDMGNRPSSSIKMNFHINSQCRCFFLFYPLCLFLFIIFALRVSSCLLFFFKWMNAIVYLV